MNGYDLERAADQFLWSHADRERCRECGASGAETGEKLSMVVLDARGLDTGLRAVAPIYRCEMGHYWHKGEGVKIGLEGVLFEQQLRHRQWREMAADPASLESVDGSTVTIVT